MIKILDVHAKGYAGATMGGMSYMINLDVPAGRFPEVEERGCDGYLLNVVVLEPQYGNTLKFGLSTKKIYEDGSLGLWGEDEEFTSEEIQLFQAWCDEFDVRADAENTKQRMAEISKEIERKDEEIRKIRLIPVNSVEEILARSEKTDRIHTEIKMLTKEREELAGGC